jgi:glycolate oxidase iron-sulfur subunit
MHLVDHARVHIEETYERPLFERMLRNVLAFVMPRPKFFRLSLMVARAAKLCAPLFTGRLRAALDLSPHALPRPTAVGGPGIYPATGQKKARVALLQGCVQSVLDPAINTAAIDLLNRFGVEVVVSRGQACCGSLTHHMGKEHAALKSAKTTIDQWTDENVDAVVITTSGCGVTVKDYGFMLREDKAYAAKAKAISAKTFDITEYLAKLDLPKVQMNLRVAYHSACTLQHGQKVKTLPQQLLENAGFTISEPKNAHLCCGSAGTYNILQPEISKQLRDQKVKSLEILEPQVIATGNIGCIRQLQSASNIPVLHTVQLLNWAYGGEKHF